MAAAVMAAVALEVAQLMVELVHTVEPQQVLMVELATVELMGKLIDFLKSQKKLKVLFLQWNLWRIPQLCFIGRFCWTWLPTTTCKHLPSKPCKSNSQAFESQFLIVSIFQAYPNLDSRFGGDDSPVGVSVTNGRPGYVGVSSFSSSSDVNGQKHRQSATSVNNNGKVTTYHTRN